MLKNQGAAFGALLHIGDPRVCKLIWPLRDALEADAVGEVIHCQTGFIPACTAEFYIDWLEGMEGDTRDGQFGLVASGLALLRKRSAVVDAAGDDHERGRRGNGGGCLSDGEREEKSGKERKT